jgi:hypothetical protein
MTGTFIRDAAERALKTAAQALLGFFGVGLLDVINADWTGGLSIALGAAVLSVLTSIVSLPISGNGTASLVNEVTDSGKHAAP